jgi:hypothetical protein
MSHCGTALRPKQISKSFMVNLELTNLAYEWTILIPQDFEWLLSTLFDASLLQTFRAALGAALFLVVSG